MIRHRYRRTVIFFARVLLSFIFWDLLLPKVGFQKWSQRTRAERLKLTGRSFRTLAVQMGGVLIKVGQFLSSRVDVLPTEITNELTGLQDEVPPEVFADIRQVAESEYGMPLEEKFYYFEETPLAAASLGQVHRAQIQEYNDDTGGSKVVEVVVKIQRPNIEDIIATDIAALSTVGKWLHKYKPIRRRANIPALLGEFARILYEEIDYLAEGRNAETFAVNFVENKNVRVPFVVWTHTTKRALTLENVWAIKISDYMAITAEGIDRSEVASLLLNIYLKQIFEDGFFHADPHPGNLFIYPKPGGRSENEGSQSWQLTFVDFGMVGRVPPKTKEGLREMIIGIGFQDADRVVKAYQMLDVLLPNADLELLAQAEAKAFEQFWGKNMSELQQLDTQELREFTKEYRDLVYTMPFQIPQDIIFLGRAIGILSGMCTGLDPEFNVWNHIAPFAEKMLVDDAKKEPYIWLENAKNIFQALLLMPMKIDATLAKMEKGEIAVKTPDVSLQVARLELAVRRFVGGIIFAALLLGGVQLHISGQTFYAGILFVGSGASLLWIIFVGRQP